MRERVTPVMTLAQISHLRSISITDTSTAKQCMRVALVTAIAELPALTHKPYKQPSRFTATMACLFKKAAMALVFQPLSNVISPHLASLLR